jgi:hypothetical protein
LDDLKYRRLTPVRGPSFPPISIEAAALELLRALQAGKLKVVARKRNTMPAATLNVQSRHVIRDFKGSVVIGEPEFWRGSGDYWGDLLFDASDCKAVWPKQPGDNFRAAPLQGDVAAQAGGSGDTFEAGQEEREPLAPVRVPPVLRREGSGNTPYVDDGFVDEGVEALLTGQAKSARAAAEMFPEERLQGRGASITSTRRRIALKIRKRLKNSNAGKGSTTV